MRVKAIGVVRYEIDGAFIHSLHFLSGIGSNVGAGNVGATRSITAEIFEQLRKLSYPIALDLVSEPVGRKGEMVVAATPVTVPPTPGARS